jgi:hypothetical protein
VEFVSKKSVCRSADQGPEVTSQVCFTWQGRGAAAETGRPMSPSEIVSSPAGRIVQFQLTTQFKKLGYGM